MKEWKLGDLVKLPGDNKKYEIYKIGITKELTEYMLWDFAFDYPGWYTCRQLEKWEQPLIGFEKK